MLEQLLVQIFEDKRNLFMYPASVFCVTTAIIYFLRMAATFLSRNKTKYGYKGLIYLSVCAVLVWHPYFGLPTNWVVFIFGTWIFSLLCVFIRLKAISEKSWKEILGWIPQVSLETVDDERLLFFAIHEKHSNWMKKNKELCIFSLGFFAVLLIGISLVTVEIYPQSVYGLLLMWWLISFSVGLYRCLFSGKSLVKFWLIHEVTIEFFFNSIIGNMLAPKLESLPVAFWCICIMFGFFWCSGAVIADHDSVKMAGRIGNTFSTLLLLAANIFLRTHQDILDVLNPALLPVVATGYLAVLIADVVEYWRKRHDLKDTGNVGWDAAAQDQKNVDEGGTHDERAL